MIKPANIPQIPEAFRIGNKISKSAVYPWMITRFLALFLICMPFWTFGQFGLNVRYLKGNADTSQYDRFIDKGFQAELEYNFRLKQKRIEFRPGIGYRQTINADSKAGHFSGIDLDLNTAVYPFDFAGDCHCPTFSKEGKVFKKGFFLELQPGASLQTFTRDEFPAQEPAIAPVKSNNLVWKLGGAVGLDIGLSDRMTLTPMISYTKISSADWEGLQDDGSADEFSDYNVLGFGLRFTHHRDEKRRRGF